ncbi:MAG: hypothetical protein MSC31_10315 [Solirubrobacteraceae bacterium MAG38_C4-C5]|nr:hypothetical protein [Candidatus Siliceabacter maunaloa]
MNAAELFAGVSALSGARDAGADGNGIAASRLVNGIEYAHATAVDERKLRAAWGRRQGGGATPLVLIADDPEADGHVRVLGPQKDGPLRRVRAEAMLGLIERTAPLKRLQAARLVAEEVERLDLERVAGLKVRGLGTEHLYGTRLPGSPRWAQLAELAEGVSRAGWRELLGDLGYAIEPLPRQGHLAKAEGRPAVVIHPRGEAAHFARLDEHGRLPEGALITDCAAHGARYGILAAGPRLRLLAAGDEDAGSATRYLELDASALEPETRPLLGLLSPRYLAGGELQALLTDARDYGQRLRERLDVVIRQHVLPGLGLGLGRWARAEGLEPSEERTRAELEAAALVFVFRALFLLYAESAGHLPMANPTYAAKSLTRTAERAWTEQDDADLNATALWDDVSALVRRMRTGQRAWDLPAYNGDLFAADAIAGAELLERAALPDAQLAPVLVALARDPDDPSVGADFSGLEIGHLGYVYEGLLSLRLTPADRDLIYDERADRYVPAQDGDEVPEARAGDLVWLTDEGGRKSGGVYYTRTELVRHLVRGAVGPAFDRHLEGISALATTDPAAAAARLFDFHVLDPACGSAHFLVEVVDELADKVAALLGQVALPAVREELDRLRSSAGATWGAGIEDTALLKRLILKRCVYGVDLSPMGAEIAKISLWLHSFVPGLSLAYLDHNVQRGNALIGVARPDAIGGEGQATLFDDAIAAAMREAAAKAAQIRATDDARPEDVRASHHADEELHAAVAGARTVFDLWTAQPLGLAGAREEALLRGQELVAGASSPLAGEAGGLARREAFLHWPLAFAEVFARENPGFDAVVGNPPWDEVTVEELGFYARYRPGLRSLAEAPRRTELARLLEERPELTEHLAAEQERLAATRRAFATGGDYVTSVGDPDVYKLFCQRYGHVLREGGALGVVLPRSAFLAKGSAPFREWLFTQAPPERIDVLVNRGSWAFEMEPRYSVALLRARRDAAAEEDQAFEVAGVADSAAAFVEQAARPGLIMRATALGRLHEVPLLPSQAAADLLARLRTGPAFPFGGGRWRCFAVREFDEAMDKGLWQGATDGRPLWKGASFDQFDPHGAGERPCPASPEAEAKAAKRRPGADSLLAEEATVAARRMAVERSRDRARVAFRDVSRATDSRTVRAALIPPATYLTNKAPYLAFLEEDPRAEAACLALLDSLVFDWQARRFVETNLNFFILEGLRLPELTEADVAPLATPAARLSCPDERFADFAAATGVQVGPLSADERAALRADIDALVARAYGLTTEELEVVFADFTLGAVPAEYRQLVRDRFAALP